MLPPKTYLLGSRYVLDISFLTAYIVTCCSTQPENAFSNGNALRKSTHTYTHTDIHVYTVHAFGYCIVTLAGHWSSNIYNMGTALWSNARFEYGFHVFLLLIDATFHHRNWHMFACLAFKMFLQELLSGSYWGQDSSCTVSFPKVASFSGAMSNSEHFEGLFEEHWPLF